MKVRQEIFLFSFERNRNSLTLTYVSIVGDALKFALRYDQVVSNLA